MPQHKHLGVLQSIDIHLGRLGQRRAFSELRIMHACNQIIQITRNPIEQRMLTAVRIAGNIERDRSVLAKQASVQRNDIGLGATQHQHAAPNARPYILVDKELVTAQVIGASRNHRAQMVGRSKHLQATLCRPVHILLNGRICMRREHRMGMNVTGKQVGIRSPYPVWPSRIFIVRIAFDSRKTAPSQRHNVHDNGVRFNTKPRFT